jgi:hypothetical protein
MELICLKLKEKGDEKQREHANVILPRYTVSCFSLSLLLPFANFIRLPTNWLRCVPSRVCACVRWRWSLCTSSTVYCTRDFFSFVLTTNRRDDSLTELMVAVTPDRFHISGLVLLQIYIEWKSFLSRIRVVSILTRAKDSSYNTPHFSME